MRLDKFLSHAADLSRVHSRRIIHARRVTVNGEVIRSSDYTIAESDIVRLDDKVIALQGLRYIMLNKPAGYVCATTDGEHPTVLDLIEENTKDLSIAGRLDLDTTGLVLVSDDGQWIHRVTSPRRECTKTYQAELDSDITAETIEQFQAGILLRNEDKPTKPATLVQLKNQRVEVTISEGKYHQVKRMFAACGHHVVNLHRVQIGSILLDNNLQPGEYRDLTAAEAAEFSQ